MDGQFLLLPNGDFPEGANIVALMLAGVRLVRPVDPPVPAPGQAVEERPAEYRDGQWWQAWALVDGKPPEEEELPPLSSAQMAFLLALTGLDKVWDAVEAKVATVSIEEYAALRGHRARALFNFSVVLSIIESLGPHIPPGVDLSPAALRAVWQRALAF